MRIVFVVVVVEDAVVGCDGRRADVAANQSPTTTKEIQKLNNFTLSYDYYSFDTVFDYSLTHSQSFTHTAAAARRGNTPWSRRRRRPNRRQ